ncbi:metal-sensitive transcriptional regulator [Alteribacillus bidgolensis]|uniref:DNA-binding transcriptional regulator, FrmR family n=1 Tax=Alteribacillus bidgolensis TaxID=930129 RepID=A0A1G8IRI8_9BACI|nr:metal-sensitive transcriptional regulator [Alteribacillus bidgolensis]SDI21625.1 DNA-binding transcriptional regulator, FrmR family [Alteribacillus bidgolensis]
MDYNDQVKNRLKRIEGQVRGVLKMMDEGKECQDIVSQMSAIRSALDRTIGVVVSENLEQCVRQQIQRGEDTEDTIKEAVSLLVKSR